ncbi:uncharacterized protein [Nicotiana sylvestris]|uniref:Integrase catalytic domain-containing protein n=2 Tax=Nicotiana TaxID=4085 RepID=A0A1S4AWH3_TOBAC|nr:PREDICTED: uncharacterized protein LOC104218878 [Nicotiana sylvestris]XP_016480977.1 PREDICTED: uncharacterized protein LOC107802052 [Nicotiana tabacum]
MAENMMQRRKDKAMVMNGAEQLLRPYFTPEQYSQILKLLKQDNTSESSTNMAGIDEVSANMAVTFFPHFCMFRNLYSGKVRGIGRERGDLYFFPQNYTKRTTAENNSWFENDVDIILRNFFNMIQTQFGKSMKLIRSDNGGEFVNANCSQIFQSLGIIHQRTCVHTPQQNGVAKRKHKHILEIATTIRFQGAISLKFWGHYVIAIAYLINRMPFVALQGKSPYEVFHKWKPNLQHLRTIGCLCFAKTLNNHDKFAARAIVAIMIGYSDSTKGYILYDIASHTFFINRGVSFRETIFPFKFKKGRPSPLLADDSLNCPILLDQAMDDMEGEAGLDDLEIVQLENDASPVPSAGVDHEVDIPIVIDIPPTSEPDT